MLTVLDLFSGIGGISLGLEATGGFRTIAFCEIEAFPRAVLAKHWPGVPIHDDVRTLTAESLGGLQPDVICGGFPCQDISVAGKGVGLSGHRSGLWFEYARLVGELRPRWVIAENVGALRTRGVDRVCSDLEAAGYSVWPLLVGAWAVGAPHKRERVWIVAHRQSVGRSGGSDAGREGETRLPFGSLRSEPSRLGVASELDNSDAGRRGREGDEVQAGRDEPERTASGVGMADPYRGRPQGEREQDRDASCDLDGQPSRHDADGRGERPVGEPTGSGLEGQRADTGEPQVTKPRHASPRWPARPGEPQYEWECPRLAHASQSDPAGRAAHERRGRGKEGPGGDGTPYAGKSGRSELPLGGAVDGLSERLARRANRESLKALGNSVVPQVVYAIGRAILDAERG